MKSVSPGSPCDGQLEINDEIISVDGYVYEESSIDELKDALRDTGECFEIL